MYSGGGQTQVTPAHNQLTGLQGGATSEFYHLDGGDYNELSVWLGQITTDSAVSQVENITLYGNIYLNNGGESSAGHEEKFIYWGDTGDVDTYIHEYTDDVLRVVTDSVLVLTMDSSTVAVASDLDVGGSVEITGNLYFDGGVAVDTIEIALTDDDTHLPTSGAVYTGIIDGIEAAAIWDRTSDGIITPATSTDPIMLFSNIYFENNVTTSHISRYIYWGDSVDGWDTYIYESADDALGIVVNSAQVFTFEETAVSVSTKLNVYGEICGL